MLDDKSRSQLLSSVNIPEGWEKIAHHMTVCMGELKDKSLLGKEYNIKVVSIGRDEKVIAVGIETDAPYKKEIKHITVAVDRTNGGKPVMSDKITNWKTLDKPFYLTGKVEEI